MDTRAGQPSFFARLFGRASAPVVAAPMLAAPAVVDVPAKPADFAGSTAVRWVRLATCQGKVVCLAGAPARLSYAARFDAAHAVLAMVPAAMPHVCVLVAPDAGRFEILADLPGIAASALIQQTDRRGVVRLRYPLVGPAFLIAMHATPETPVVRFDGAGDTIDVAFTLVDVTGGDVPAAAAALGREIGLAASFGLRAGPLLDLLGRGSVRPELAEALIRAMPRDEMAELAKLLLERPRLVTLLGRAMPHGGWVGVHLAGLAAWLAARETRLPERLRWSPAEEAPALYPVKEIDLVPAGLVLNSLARRHVLPRRMACVLATAKNEGIYLLDWIAYHLSIGFEHIFLYSNDNADGSDELLAALDAAGVITWIRNARGVALGAQEKAYAHALNRVPQILDYRWAAVIDLDEYLVFDTALFDDVQDFIGLQECQSVDAIALNWLLFGAPADQRWAEAPVYERLTLRQASAPEHIKTILRPRLFWWSRPHNPVSSLKAPFEYRLPDGSLHHHAGVADRLPAFAARPEASQAWVNHYFARTAEEALWKWHRGRANWLDESERDLFLELVAVNFTRLAEPGRLVEDRRVLDCAGGHAAARERLRALPGVAAADAAIMALFRTEIVRVRADFLARPPGSGESDAVRQFRTIISEIP